MAPDIQATWGVSVDFDDASPTAFAGSLEDTRKKAEQLTEAIKANASSLRLLRGSSDEVKTAKEALKAKLDAERSALSRANLEIIKGGTSLATLNKQSVLAAKSTNDATKAQKSLTDAFKLVGGPVQEASEGLEKVGALLGPEGIAAVALAGGVALFGAAFVVATTAIVSGTVALSKWVVTSGDAMRSLALSRQYIAGSAADSERMGDQIDRLRQKVPLTTDELSKMYTQVRDSFDGARVSGQGILELVTAVSSATAAGADKAAAKIQEIAERGKNLGRVRVDMGFNAFSGGSGGKGEFAGTGLDPDKFAGAVAATMKISLDKAKVLLRTTGVDMATYTKAAVVATNAAFGQINADKMIAIDATTKRFHDDIDSLTRGVNLRPILQTISDIEAKFSQTSVTGYALKEGIKALANAFGLIATKDGPAASDLIDRIVLQALKLEIVLLQNKKAIVNFFKFDAKGTIDDLETIWDVLKKIAFVANVASQPLKDLFSVTKGAAGLLAADAPQTTNDDASRIQTTGGGSGLTGPGGVTIAPPHARGGLVAAPAPGEYFASVAPGESIVPVGGDSGGGGRSGGAANVTVTITVNAGTGNARETVQSIKASSLIPDLTKALEDILKGRGVPTQAAAR